jgi:general secretion pathway protein N
MVKWFKILGLALLSGVTLTAGPLPAALAATSATLDILPDDGAGKGADTVDLGSVKPISRPGPEAARPLPGGNPLWAVPLSVLTATQARPIFSASRRPPPRAVVAPPVDQARVPAPQKAAEPEHPPLALIGAVVGESDAIAVFLDRTNQKVIRLRQGETHGGWVLSSVLGREVTLRKADRAEVLALQRPEAPAGAPSAPPGTAAVPGLVLPAAGSTDTSYAPYVPRSTPKNGESDGL